MKKQNNFSYRQAGFTLIELLASTVVIVAVSAIVLTIIVSVLRGSNKTNSINTTRQNGTYTISQISKMLRFVDTLDAVDGGTPSICVTNTLLPTPPPVRNFTSITYTSIDGGQTTLSCVKLNGSPTTPYTIASNGASLLDNTAVQIPNGECHITCTQSTKSDAVIIGVDFTLTTLQPTGLVEFRAAPNPLQYKTSIILRNVGR